MKPQGLLVPVIATLSISGGIAQQSAAADIELTIEIPRLEVGEYHRPYVASWIENGSQAHVADLLVWYDVEMKNGEGATWLKDLRQWWRKSGRSAKVPIDGVTGPTRPVGSHDVTIPMDRVKLASLESGEYSLVVEASREVGGREILRIPFKWDGKTAVEGTTQGKSELGKIQFRIKTK